MPRSGLARTLVCLWVLWSMFYVDAEQKFVRLSPAPLAVETCMVSVRKVAGYERKPGPLRYYADISLERRRQHPTGYWVGCFPEDFDPRDK